MRYDGKNSRSAFYPDTYETMISSERRCPSCDGEFLAVPISDRHVDVCEKCHGMFFEFDEMATVLSVPAKERFESFAYGDGRPDRTEPLTCPKCGRTMAETEYALSKVHVDQCAACHSVFLDAGEDEEIARYFASLESPEAVRNENAKDAEKWEALYQKRLAEMARGLLDQIEGN